jgi:hypothetical protein
MVSGGRGGIMGCTQIQPRAKLYKHSTSGLSSLRPGEFACANSVCGGLREIAQRAPICGRRRRSRGHFRLQHKRQFIGLISAIDQRRRQ